PSMHTAVRLAVCRGCAVDLQPTNCTCVGTTSAASIPLLLAEAAVAGELQPGHRVLIAGFGGGLAWGAGTLIWPDITAFAGIGDHLSSSLTKAEPTGFRPTS